MRIYCYIQSNHIGAQARQIIIKNIYLDVALHIIIVELMYGSKYALLFFSSSAVVVTVNQTALPPHICQLSLRIIIHLYDILFSRLNRRSMFSNTMAKRWECWSHTYSHWPKRPTEICATVIETNHALYPANRALAKRRRRNLYCNICAR